MPLRPDQTQRIIEALNAKKGAHTATCPTCGHQQFMVSTGMASIGVADTPGIFMNPSYMPTVGLICTNCGTTIFVNLRILGLIDIAEGTDTAPGSPPTTQSSAEPAPEPAEPTPETPAG